MNMSALLNSIAVIIIAFVLFGLATVNKQQSKRVEMHNKQIGCLEMDLVYVFGDFCAKVDEHGFIIRDN